MTLRCCVCENEEKTEEDLRVHITVRHVHYIPLECHHCKHVFLPTFTSLTQHYAEVHTSKLPVATAILSYDASKAAEVNRLVTQSQLNTNSVQSATNTNNVKPKKRRQQSKAKAKKVRLAGRLKRAGKRSHFRNINKMVAENVFDFQDDPRSGDEVDCSSSLLEPKKNVDNQLHYIREDTEFVDLHSGDNCEAITMQESISREDKRMETDDNCEPVIAQKSTSIEDNRTEIDNNSEAVTTQKSTFIEVERLETNDHCEAVIAQASTSPEDKHPEMDDNSEANITHESNDRENKHMETDDNCEINIITHESDNGEEERTESDDGEELHLYLDEEDEDENPAELDNQNTREKDHNIEAEINVDTTAVDSVKDGKDGQTIVLSPIDPNQTDTVVSELGAFEQVAEDTTSILYSVCPPVYRSPSNRRRQKRVPQVCQLCQKTISNNYKSQHIWGSHVSTPRFQCCLCLLEAATTGSIRAHMRKHPENRGDYIDRLSELLDEHKSISIRAYPQVDTIKKSKVRTLASPVKKVQIVTPRQADADTPSSSKSVPTNRTATKLSFIHSFVPHEQKWPSINVCALCGWAPFNNWVARSQHLWRQHMPKERYGCLLCKTVRANRSDHIRQHCNKYHEGHMEFVLDKKWELRELYLSLSRKAFPAAPQSAEVKHPPVLRLSIVKK